MPKMNLRPALQHLVFANPVLPAVCAVASTKTEVYRACMMGGMLLELDVSVWSSVCCAVARKPSTSPSTPEV